MQLSAIKQLVQEVEPLLDDRVFVELHSFERNGRTLRLALTDRLRRVAHRNRVWNSKQFLTALKNAQYGFDAELQKSAGGRDGIFLLDRHYRPANAMMRKLFDHYLDKPGSGAEDLAGALGTTVDRLYPVRLVSHHLRFLGVLHRTDLEDWLVLVDYDATQ